MVKCSVPQCPATSDVTIHRFPHDSAIGQQWVLAIKNPQVLQMTYADIRKKKVSVCRLHFTDSCYLAQTNRPTLKPDAVPSLMLPTAELMSTGTVTDVQVMPQEEVDIYLQFPDQSSPGLRYNVSPKSPHIRKSLSMADGQKVHSPIFRIATSESLRLDDVQRTSVTEAKRPREDSPSILKAKKKREDDSNSDNLFEDLLRHPPSSSTTKKDKRPRELSPSILEVKKKREETIDDFSIGLIGNPALSSTPNKGESTQATDFNIIFNEEKRTTPKSSRKVKARRLLDELRKTCEVQVAKSNRIAKKLTKSDDIDCNKKRKISKGAEIEKLARERKFGHKKAKRIILGSGVKRMTLTPKARKIFDAASEVRKKLYTKNKAVKRFAVRLKAAKKYQRLFATKFSRLSRPQQLFIEMQLRNVDLKPRGRKFTKEEKVLALSMFKKSPAAYTHMASLFSLPSKTVLKDYLSGIPLDTGINTSIVEHLTDLSKDLSTKDKQVSACWDEAHVQPHVSYDFKKDKIIGFEDFGTHRTSQFADHVLVFMIRRLSDGAEVPFSYYYCLSQTKYGQLIECIRENVAAVASTGFKLVVTICDQGSSNMKALKELKQEYLKECKRKGLEPGDEVEMTVEGVTFIAVYDTSHVLKGLRNNTMKKDLDLGDGSLVKWVHFQTAYELDSKCDKAVRSLPRITAAHVYEELMKKMKVIIVAQVLSSSMSKFIATTCKYDKAITTRVGPLKMPLEAAASSIFANLVDTSFDSMNATNEKRNEEKPMRNIVTKDSGHTKYWPEARAKFMAMHFVDSEGNRSADPPSLTHWSWNLRSMSLIWKRLQEAGFDTFKPGFITQDIIENFFGCLRSYSHRFVNLTCLQVDGLFKTLLLNNLTSSHSVGANCKDDGLEALQSLGKFLQHAGVKEAQRVMPLHNDHSDEGELPDTTVRGATSQLGNIAWLRYAGSFLVKLGDKAKMIKVCPHCQKVFYSSLRQGNELAAIPEPNRQGSRRTAALDYFERGFVRGMTVIRRKLCVIAFQSDLRKKLATYSLKYMDFEWITCPDHKEELKQKFLDLLILENIYHWCVHINRLLTGRQTEHGNSILEQRAVTLYEATRRRKAALDNVKKAAQELQSQHDIEPG